MEEITLKSWNEFPEALGKVDKYRDECAKESTGSISEILYRGQENSCWGLETTLERTVGKNVTLDRYYGMAHAAKTRVETFTGKTWNIPLPPDPLEWLVKKFNRIPVDFPAYDYFVYLRHHGYPSPFIDWTLSPYIAAFFAFRNISIDVEYVSVFAFLEYVGKGSIGADGEPGIHGLNPYVTAHKRHYLQQSNYTICVVMGIDNEYYASHEKAVSNYGDDQNVLWKINIPACERKNALRELNRMNINAYSLFSTEDTLMEATAVTEILLKGR